jgi:hypothetical protein
VILNLFRKNRNGHLENPEETRQKRKEEKALKEGSERC